MKLPADCEAALAQLDAYRRGSLPPDEVTSMQEHLDGCRDCLSYKVHEEAFLDRLSNAARNHVCPEELRTAIEQMIANEARGN
jgi:Putative zinc-finger